MPDLARFHTAQAAHLGDALAELRAGAKRTHWMWFVFPQHVALGRSPMAERFGIDGLGHARAYLADPVLAANLDAAMGAMLTNAGSPPEAVLGPVDALKLHSCATLFEAAGAARARPVLDAFHGGAACPRTEALIA